MDAMAAKNSVARCLDPKSTFQVIAGPAAPSKFTGMRKLQTGTSVPLSLYANRENTSIQYTFTVLSQPEGASVTVDNARGSVQTSEAYEFHYADPSKWPTLTPTHPGTYKVHLDGYDQMNLITGKGPSARKEIFYFTEGNLSAVRVNDYKYRFTDQPNGWLGATVHVDWPILTNLRLDPYERTGLPTATGGSLAYYNWFVNQFWRFVFVQDVVAKLGQTAIDFPPMQPGASFNLQAVKEQIKKAMASKQGD